MTAVCTRAGMILFAMLLTTPVCAQPDFEEIDAAIAAGEFTNALRLIDAGLDDHRGNPGLRLKRAQVLSYSGRQAVALRELNRLRSDYPGDVDYVLARARVLGHLDRDTEALEELRLARQIAPDYEAVWILEDSLLARRSNPAYAGEREALRNKAAIRFPGSSRWRTAAAESDPEWTVRVGGSHENLSGGFDDWDHQFVELTRISAASGQLGARLGRDTRGSSADLSLGLSVERSFASNWFAGADLSLADNPAFQPDTGFSLHAGKSLADGWVADLRYRRRDYATTSVGSVIGTVEKYFGDFRLAYSLGVSKLDGASSFTNHVASFNWYYRDDASIGITFNTGKEAESIGNGRVLETDVDGLALTGRTPLNDRFGLSWWLGVHDQGDLYRRRFLGLAVSYRI